MVWMNNSTKILLLKIEDSNDKALKCVEIIFSTFVDFSNTLDTIDFSILLQQLHKVHFSNRFLYLVQDYISNQTHFVQIISIYFSIL